MDKKFCDICNKEITGNYYYARFSIWPHDSEGEYVDTGADVKEYMDICPECFNNKKKEIKNNKFLDKIFKTKYNNNKEFTEDWTPMCIPPESCATLLIHYYNKKAHISGYTVGYYDFGHDSYFFMYDNEEEKEHIDLIKWRYIPYCEG